MSTNTPRNSFLGRLLDLISPRSCAVCHNRLNIAEHVLCARCNLHLPRTGYADYPYDNEMAKIFWGRIPIERCAALIYYESGAQVSNLIYRLKYGNEPEIGIVLGEMMAKELVSKGFFEGIDVIVPVPLARKRERRRGYNQSEKIAHGIENITHIPVVTDAVERAMQTETQTHKNRWERADNVSGAFRLCQTARIQHQHLLLVDDVVTTGMTVSACGEELKQVPGVTISVLTWGRTPSV